MLPQGVRDLVCQQYAGNGTYCLTALLTAVQVSSWQYQAILLTCANLLFVLKDAKGTDLTLNEVTGILTGGGLSQLISEVPPSAVCVALHLTTSLSGSADAFTLQMH